MLPVAETEAATPLSLRQTMARLEEIVAALENDTMDLEDALLAYEEGVRLAQACMDRLDTTELRIQQIALT